jgi:hypothetical protein
MKHIFSNATEFYAATSAEEAERLCREANGEEPGEDDDGRTSAGPWEQLPDDSILAVTDEDGARHVFPCSRWANNDPDASPHGFVASTEA